MVEALDRATRQASLTDRRRLTVFTGDAGIVRCAQGERDAMIDALASIDEVDGRPARVVTLVTSGTIKKVKGHLGLDKGV
jgi:RNase P/RNase MRP subunit POP5